MEIINFSVPAFPYFVTAGSALYRAGDMHRSRSSIGVFDLIYVEYGELYITENNHPYAIGPGDYLILNPTGKHYSEKPVGTETLYHWLHFAHDGEYIIDDKVRKLDRKSSSLYVASKSTVSIPVFRHFEEEDQSAFMQIHKELSSLLFDNYQHSFVPLRDQSLSAISANQLLLKLLKLLQIEETERKSERIASDMMDFLEQNYTKDINLKSLSAKYNFHPAHVIRIFKSEYGITPIDALIKLRINKASELLLNTNMQIIDISENVGFKSVSYFSKIFKSHTGMSPRDFRNKRKNS